MDLNFTSIAGGGPTNYQFCGIQVVYGDVFCWGGNSDPWFIGFGTSPTNGAGPYLSFTSVAMGGDGHACGLVASGAAWCWGEFV